MKTIIPKDTGKVYHKKKSAEMNATKKIRKKNKLKLWLYMLKKHPFYGGVYILLDTTSIVILNIVNVFTVKYIVSNDYSFRKICICFTLLVVISVMLKFFTSFLGNYFNPILSEKLGTDLLIKLFDITHNVKYEKFETPAFLDDCTITKDAAQDIIIKTFNNIKDFVKYLAVFIMFFLFSYTSDKIGLVFVTISSIITLLVNKKISKLNMKQREELTMLMRKRDYIRRIMETQEFSKELKSTNLYDISKKAYSDTNYDIEKHFVKYFKRYYIPLNIIKEFFGNYFIINILYSGWIAYNTIITKNISFDVFSALIVSVWSLNAITLDISNNIYDSGFTNRIVTKIEDFIDSAGRDKDNPMMKMSNCKELNIRISNLSFTYLGHNLPVLHDINMEINDGKKIAIVGPNGSGKSTLLKLICGLYNTESITCNGININQIDNYKTNISIMFQDYNLYAISTYENLCMDFVTYDKIDKAKILLKDLSMDSILSDDSLLMREFNNNGFVLSGGMKQKLALVKAIIKESKILILDEPSSRLDNNSIRMIEKLLAESNKTIIIVTHNLALTKKVDNIYVLKQGEICESGTHRYLCDKKGLYYKMINSKS